MFSIPDELKKLPSKPGVYLMKDESNHVIYVGKAINLRNRVRSYFRSSTAASDPKVRSMVTHITHFEYIVTDNEVEAIILECNLIKQHTPKYNIRLKDNKAYPYIKVTEERLPRIVYAHQRDQKRGKTGKFFGPYPSGDRIREILNLIHDIWPLRRCHRRFPRDYDKGRPCLQYHIGHCKAPCHRYIAEEEYQQMINEAISLIQGKIAPVVEKLSQKMEAHSEALEFEKAAELRDLLQALKMLTEKQKAENTSGDDRDVIALARKDDESLVQVFFVRNGKMIGREHFMMQNTPQNFPNEDILEAFIKQFYGEAAFIPKELVIVQAPSDRENISNWLTQLKGQRVHITVPQKGEKHQLLQLAVRNADLTMEQFGMHIKREATRNQSAISELAEALQLSEPPARIEAYDISNIQGFESVGSMVVFEDGKSKNSDYRKFKIKGVHGPNDYASMEEIITRRFKRYLNEQKEKEEGKFSKLPDLLMIDGGKGQVHAAEEVLIQMGISIPVCGMVKDDRHRTRGLIYQDVEISMPRNSEGFRLITRIQDEVHRFALEYHRKLRADSQVRSVLDDITGIGPTRRKALMRHFKGIDPIRRASIEELALVDTMNQKSAEAVYNFFRSP
ncbi:MAG: excinuclease ABC subunit UvrC [Defluviitaleaceae bacterium]|nr:excinuclease ABC subunit UvrC [Defluviitaleaceae bacterium]